MNIAAIIVLYYPNIEKIKCIQKAIFPQVDHIIYIDNTPEVSSIHNILTHSHEHLITNNVNLGIAKAQNQGTMRAIEYHCTHVLFLDQDSIPTEGMVKELMEGFKYKTNIGIIGPTCINAFDSSIDNTGIQIRGITLRKINLSSRFNEVSYLISSGSIIPIDVFNEVGLMQEDMFIDGVDFEWCLRAISKGYVVLQARDALLRHELGNGNKDKVLNHSPFREYYIVKNSFRMIGMKHIPIGYKFRRFIMSIGRIISNCTPSKYEYLRQDLTAIKNLKR